MPTDLPSPAPVLKKKQKIQATFDELTNRWVIEIDDSEGRAEISPIRANNLCKLLRLTLHRRHRSLRLKARGLSFGKKTV